MRFQQILTTSDSFKSLSHLPEALELPLLDSKQPAGLSADNGSVTWCVVQDRFPERCPNPQCADSDCILNTSKHNIFVGTTAR